MASKIPKLLEIVIPPEPTLSEKLKRAEDALAGINDVFEHPKPGLLGDQILPILDGYYGK